ncbi:MAG: hypothetical protein ACREVR_21385 [Burkholderiales bacterium]
MKSENTTEPLNINEDHARLPRPGFDLILMGFNFLLVILGGLGALAANSC